MDDDDDDDASVSSVKAELDKDLESLEELGEEREDKKKLVKGLQQLVNSQVRKRMKCKASLKYSIEQT